MTVRTIAAVLLVGYTGLLLLLTLGPVPQRLVGMEAPLGVLSLDRWFEASTWESGRAYEFVFNVLIFVPWGALAFLALGERRWVLAGLVGVALTAGIEIAQIPLPRISDPRDLLANTLGVLLGVSAVGIVRAAVLRSRARMSVGSGSLSP